jgi:integrase/recombinase XerD
MVHYSLIEVSKITGLSQETVKTKRKRGEVSGLQIPKGKRLVWVYTAEDLEHLKSTVNPPPSNHEFEGLLNDWLGSLLNGWLTGRPLGKRTIINYKYGINLIAKHLNLNLNLKNLTQDNLRIALSNVPVSDQNKKCHYALKAFMYNSFNSFNKYLIEKNIKPKNFLEGIQKLKPKRVYPARKTIVYQQGLEALLKKNHQVESGRSLFDIHLTEMIILLAALAGLRKSEIINLKMQDIDLNQAVLWVYNGKGHKDRPIGMRPELVDACRNWLLLRAKTKPRADGFLVMQNGEGITGQVIRGRIERLRVKAGIDITCHGLRRAFVTIHAHAGIPLIELQAMAGHSDLKTTQGYTITNVQQAMASLQNFNQDKTSVKETSLNNPEKTEYSRPRAQLPDFSFLIKKNLPKAGSKERSLLEGDRIN